MLIGIKKKELTLQLQKYRHSLLLDMRLLGIYCHFLSLISYDPNNHNLFSSNELSWCLLTLAQYPNIQKRLREELLTIPSDEPSMDELNALPFLDAVVRETMRLHGVVPFTNRKAMQDDVIPFAEPFVDKKGVVRTELRLDSGLFRVRMKRLLLKQDKEGPTRVHTREWGQQG